MARAHQCGDDLQASRSAISVKAIGKASAATQTRTPTAMMVPASRSLAPTRSPPTANIIEIAAPAKPATTCAMLMVPFGRNSPVASVSSLPSRAPIAAPSRPTQIVRLSVNGPGAGNAAVQQQPRRDLRERQQHDARQSESREKVLGARERLDDAASRLLLRLPIRITLA